MEEAERFAPGEGPAGDLADISGLTDREAGLPIRSADGARSVVEEGGGGAADVVPAFLAQSLEVSPQLSILPSNPNPRHQDIANLLVSDGGFLR